VPQALEHARAMLAPSQQRLPDALSAQLSAAVLAEADAAAAHANLTAACDAARRLGYL
jgi:hypothetical protein